jgi:hypothetical protein
MKGIVHAWNKANIDGATAHQYRTAMRTETLEISTFNEDE